MRILYDNALLNRDVVLDMKLHESTLCDNGKIPDKSKYHNNATITGATWTPPYGYSLDGIDDLLNCGTNSNLNLTSAGTVEAVFYSTLTSNYQGIVVKGVGAWEPENNYQLLIGPDNKLFFAIGGNGVNHKSTVPILLITNTWYHAIGTWDGSTVRLYINGVLVSSVSQGAVNAVAVAGALYIGTWESYNLNGRVSEAIVYNASLIDSSAKQHYLAAKERLTWANLP